MSTRSAGTADETFELPPPRHVAIIMDGNGRWAEALGKPRNFGHRKGVETVRKVVRLSRDLGIEYLTLYSFSSENWKRPKTEISELFSLLKMFVRKDMAELDRNNVRVRVIGSRKGLPDDIAPLLDEVEARTKDNDGQTLIIAFNYGAREEIAQAVRAIAERTLSGDLAVEDITEDTVSETLYTADIPDPDLLIRTSGEQRVSNFLLWQIAYSELEFVDCHWPDFDEHAYRSAVRSYRRRDRKFGGLNSGVGDG